MTVSRTGVPVDRGSELRDLLHLRRRSRIWIVRPMTLTMSPSTESRVSIVILLLLVSIGTPLEILRSLRSSRSVRNSPSLYSELLLIRQVLYCVDRVSAAACASVSARSLPGFPV